VKLVQLFGFIIKKFVTMHGHKNVKFGVPCVCRRLLFGATVYTLVIFTLLESRRVGNM